MMDYKDILRYFLSNEKALSVFKIISDSPKSFTDIKEKLKIKFNPELSRILQKLDNYGLIYNVLKRGNPSKYYSFYHISPTGETIIKLLSDIDNIITNTSDE